MLKKMISTVLVFVMMVSIIPIMDSKKSEAISKEEVPDGYTPIYDEADLAGINNNPEGKYILMNDIDLSETKKGGKLDTGNGWKPLDEFYGELDGNGHYIKNMHIYGSLNEEYYGLFQSMRGIVKRLGMLNVDIDIKGVNWRAYVGAIAGNGDGWVEQCFVTGTISENISVKKDYTRLNLGCYFGSYNDFYGLGVIKDCYNGANIVVSDNNITNTGAFIAHNTRTSKNNALGGIIRCYNVGNIANGMGNLFDDFCNVTNCFYLQGSGVGEEQGSPLTESQMKKKQYYTNFDFENTWEIDSCYKYQYPQLKECVQQRVTELKIEKLPSKMVYFQGDKLLLTGGEVNITYEDGYKTITSMTGDMLGKYDMTKLGEVNIPIVKGGKTISFTVTVNPIEVTKVSLNKTKLLLKLKEKYQLSASVSPTNATNQSISWDSSNDNVATVDQRGYVKALKYGTTIITAKSSNGKKAQCTVIVGTKTKKGSSQKGNATSQKVSKVKIKSVKNLKGKKIKVVWKKIKGVDGYEIEIARNRKMTKNRWSKDTSKTSVICKKRKKKKYYYVRVRAYYETEDEIIEGAWSTVKKVKVTK